MKISPRISHKMVSESVEHLQNSFWPNLELQGSFTLQFENLDFNNTLCNCHLNVSSCTFFGMSHLQLLCKSQTLLNQGLPWTQPVYPPESHPCPSAFIKRYLQIISEWPSPFSIPAFSYDVELKLHKGNEAYEKTKKCISITRDMKMDILDKIAQAAFEVKAYPDQDLIESFASAVVS